MVSSEQLRQRAEYIIKGREAFEQQQGRKSTKPLRKVELTPQEVLELFPAPNTEETTAQLIERLRGRPPVPCPVCVDPMTSKFAKDHKHSKSEWNFYLSQRFPDRVQ